MPRLSVLGASLLVAACGTGGPIYSTAPVASLVVVPTSGELRVGETLQLFADLRDERGRVLAGRMASGASLQPSVAGVSADGVVTALSPGTA